MSRYTLIWRCQECGWRGDDSEIIQFKDPVMENNYWSICPQCRAAESFDNMCDAPECKQIASSGWPSPDGYRRTCHIHYDYRRKQSV